MEEVCQIVGSAPAPGALSWPPLALIGAAIMWKSEDIGRSDLISLIVRILYMCV